LKLISLTQNKFAIVDDGEYESLKRHKWHTVNSSRGVFSAGRTVTDRNGKQTLLLMHRLLLNAPPNLQVDHRNHDTLDNRKENLRLCTNGQNCANRKVAWGTSKYKGVSLFKSARWKRSKWKAQIKFNGTVMYLGLFDNQIEAARAYDVAAQKLHKEFACVNFPEEVKTDGEKEKRSQI